MLLLKKKKEGSFVGESKVRVQTLIKPARRFRSGWRGCLTQWIPLSALLLLHPDGLFIFYFTTDALPVEVYTTGDETRDDLTLRCQGCRYSIVFALRSAPSTTTPTAGKKECSWDISAIRRFIVFSSTNSLRNVATQRFLFCLLLERPSTNLDSPYVAWTNTHKHK